MALLAGLYFKGSDPLSSLFAVHQVSSAGVEHGLLAIELSTQRTVAPQKWIPFAFVAIMVPMILASFKFMWDIRHPKNE